ncbi:hypothetical protein AGRA3207_007853 (plasmid) [Actinomadura graeca]|uniref:Uncharacterized protein n=1 Tax=Actinomadura graeca TaxID=2750812 RepID=A0ABX8R957_9ACTN|nr:hypothetical protein [Actinomadura graeca]QXJ27056.1 hypothetical protein AGRA3207_007853 [Actinomadura graeca]
MSDSEQRQEHHAGDRVTERLAGRDCRWCGTWVPYRGTGRPRDYCSKSCRNRASEVRTIEARLGRQLAAGRLRTAPVREVVERVVERVIERPAAPARPDENEDEGRDEEMAVLAGDVLAVPATAREWRHVLDLLATALTEPGPLRARHYDHRHIHHGLVAVLRALDHAHPGGLADLD